MPHQSNSKAAAFVSAVERAYYDYEVKEAARKMGGVLADAGGHPSGVLKRITFDDGSYAEGQFLGINGSQAYGINGSQAYGINDVLGAGDLWWLPESAADQQRT